MAHVVADVGTDQEALYIVGGNYYPPAAPANIVSVQLIEVTSAAAYDILYILPMQNFNDTWTYDGSGPFT